MQKKDRTDLRILYLWNWNCVKKILNASQKHDEVKKKKRTESILKAYLEKKVNPLAYNHLLKEHNLGRINFLLCC